MSSREDTTSGGPTESLQTSLSSTYRLRHCSDSLALFIKSTPALLLLLCRVRITYHLALLSCLAKPQALINRYGALLLALLCCLAKPQPLCFSFVGFAPSLCQTSIVLLLCCWLCSVALPNLTRGSSPIVGSAPSLCQTFCRTHRTQKLRCLVVGFAPSLRQIQLFQLYLLLVPSLLPCASYQSTNFLHCSTILPINFHFSTDNS